MRAVRGLWHWRPLGILVLGLWAAWSWYWHVAEDFENNYHCDWLKPAVERRLRVQMGAIYGVTALVTFLARRRRGESPQ
jgi:hypothetical protein